MNRKHFYLSIILVIGFSLIFSVSSTVVAEDMEEELFFEEEIVNEVKEVVGSSPSAEDLPDEIVVGLSWNEKMQSLLYAWEDSMISYSEQYGEEMGIDFDWVINVADGDPGQQLSNIEDLIAQDVDIIIARAQDSSAIGAAINAANEAGIPFITFDRESEDIEPTAHVGADSFDEALLASEHLAEMLEEEGVAGEVEAIEIMGDLSDINAVNRSQAWEQVEEETGAWETVRQVPTEWDPSEFRSGTAEALSAVPDAEVMFVHSDFAWDSIEGAFEAEDKDMKDMWIAVQDLNPQGLKAMEDGKIDVATTYDAYHHSIAAVEVIGQIISGEDIDGDKFYITGRVATPDNIDELDYIWSRDYDE